MLFEVIYIVVSYDTAKAMQANTPIAVSVSTFSRSFETLTFRGTEKMKQTTYCNYYKQQQHQQVQQ